MRRRDGGDGVAAGFARRWRRLEGRDFLDALAGLGCFAVRVSAAPVCSVLGSWREGWCDQLGLRGGRESGTDSGLRVWVSRPVRARRRWRGAAAAACRRARDGRAVLAVRVAALLRVVLPWVGSDVEDLMLHGWNWRWLVFWMTKPRNESAALGYDILLRMYSVIALMNFYERSK